MTPLAGQLGPLGVATKAPAWSPAALPNLAFWVDADDAASVTHSAGLVTQWADKSGSGRHAVSSGAKRPTIGNATINGKPTISSVVRGQNIWMDDPTLLANPTTTLAVFRFRGAVNLTDWPTGYRMIIGHTDAADVRNGGALFYQRYNNTWASYPFFNSNAFADGFGTANSDTPYMASLESGLTGVTNRRAFISGSQAYSAMPDALPAQNTRLSILAGDQRAINQTQDSAADVAEVIICSSNLSDADRQIAEGYLAHKWGTTGALPAAHPYKTEAP